MIKRICIQAGHWGKAGGGAPEEQANNKRIVDRVSFVLREKGFEVYQTDYYAFNDAKVTKVDYDLFLSCHCDMDYPDDGGSGFADFPEPRTDGATNESQRICKIINDTYFPEVKINYKSHSNKNTRFYYMWKYLTSKSPCVLLEMGQSIDTHDKVLLANTDLITTGIVKSICKAFSVSYEIVTPNPIPVDPHLAEIQSLKDEVARLNILIDQSKNDLLSLMAEKDSECQIKLMSYKNKIINFINTL